MQERIVCASSPPPVASKPSVAPVASKASVSFSAKSSSAELQICLAPTDFKISTCCCERTILTNSTPSLAQCLTNICPRLEAAAVCTSAVWFSSRMVSKKHSTVSGLTKDEAASTEVVPSLCGKHIIAGTTTYFENEWPDITATTLPSRALAAGLSPVATT